jgi:hypothetical protein
MMGRLSVCQLHLTTALQIESSLSSGEDIYFESDTAKIATDLVEDLLGHASGKDVDGKPVLTFSDLSEVLRQRLADCKINNPEYSLTFALRLFGLGK